jgi:ribonuclease P protein component
MVGRILRSADFERVLALRPCSRSTHFAVHHVAAGLSALAKGRKQPAEHKLSTGDEPSCPQPVDELPANGWWLGLVVPKRHARRAVTRNLIKRQMRCVMTEQAEHLPQGLWVLRLKAVFDLSRFASPGSVALRQAARDELSGLLQRTAGQFNAPRAAVAAAAGIVAGAQASARA